VDRQHRDFSELRRHAKVYSFRIITAVLAWVFIGVAFYYRPDWIKWGSPNCDAWQSKSSFENSAGSSGFRSQPSSYSFVWSFRLSRRGGGTGENDA